MIQPPCDMLFPQRPVEATFAVHCKFKVSQVSSQSIKTYDMKWLSIQIVSVEDCSNHLITPGFN